MQKTNIKLQSLPCIRDYIVEDCIKLGKQSVAYLHIGLSKLVSVLKSNNEHVTFPKQDLAEVSVIVSVSVGLS